MLLNNVQLAGGNRPASITTAQGTISGVGEPHTPDSGEPSLDFTGAIAFPGLINSHDHLDFNCFSPLGQKQYNNYTEWGKYIHDRYRKDISAVLAIPQELRTRWGVYKNLLAGVTTVVNHGKTPSIGNALITLCRQHQDLHSVAFENGWRWKLNNPLRLNRPCVIHTGEGIDVLSRREIDRLLRYNFLKRKIIGVHGVAMNVRQARKFRALVWCPVSNEVLLSAHAGISRLKEHTTVVFGTDSALTGSWDVWQHLRMARALQQAGDEELFRMITSVPASLWKCNAGEIRAGAHADIVVARSHGTLKCWDTFFATKPEDLLIVMHRGAIRLFDEQVLPQLDRLHVSIRQLSRITINGSVKFVEGDLPALISAIRRYYPAFRCPVDVSNTSVYA